jgi:putative flippase GtrA
MRKKDYFLVSIIGFLVGWLILLPAKNLGFNINPKLIVISVLFFTFFAPFALAVLYYLSRFFKILEQFGRFAAVGTLNASLDLGILNFLIFFTNISRGIYFIAFKALSFIVATTNSYFWNKFWTFQSKSQVALGEYLRFALLTIGGVLIDVTVASIIVNVIGPPAHFAPKVWANVGAVIGALAAMFWNFIAYRFLFLKYRQDAKQNDH